MNQYIITEELRDLIMYRLLNEGYSDLLRRLKRETDDNPYNPQAERDDPTYCVCGLTDKQCQEKNGWLQQEAREKMLDLLVDWIGEHHECCGKRMVCYSVELSKFLDELREGKDGE